VIKLANSYRNWVDISADAEIGSLRPKKHVPQAADNSSTNTSKTSKSRTQTHKTTKRQHCFFNCQLLCQRLRQQTQLLVNQLTAPNNEPIINDKHNMLNHDN